VFSHSNVCKNGNRNRFWRKLVGSTLILKKVSYGNLSCLSGQISLIFV